MKKTYLLLLSSFLLLCGCNIPNPSSSSEIKGGDSSSDIQSVEDRYLVNEKFFNDAVSAEAFTNVHAFITYYSGNTVLSTLDITVEELKSQVTANILGMATTTYYLEKVDADYFKYNEIEGDMWVKSAVVESDQPAILGNLVNQALGNVKFDDLVLDSASKSYNVYNSEKVNILNLAFDNKQLTDIKVLNGASKTTFVFSGYENQKVVLPDAKSAVI